MLRRAFELLALEVEEAQFRVGDGIGLATAAVGANRIRRRGRRERKVRELGVEVSVVHREQQVIGRCPLRVEFETAYLRLAGVEQTSDGNARGRDQLRADLLVVVLDKERGRVEAEATVSGLHLRTELVFLNLFVAERKLVIETVVIGILPGACSHRGVTARLHASRPGEVQQGVLGGFEFNRHARREVAVCALQFHRHARRLLHAATGSARWCERIKERIQVVHRRSEYLEAREARILAAHGWRTRRSGTRRGQRRRTVHADDRFGLIRIPTLERQLPRVGKVVLHQTERGRVLDLARVKPRNRIHQTENLIRRTVLTARTDCRLAGEERIGRHRSEAEDVDRASRLRGFLLPVQNATHEIQWPVEIRAVAQLLAELRRIVLVVESRRA